MTPGDAGDHAPHPFMTVVEVAAALRVSRATIYRLVHGGVLPGIQVGRSVRVPREAVDDVLRGSPPRVP